MNLRFYNFAFFSLTLLGGCSPGSVFDGGKDEAKPGSLIGGIDLQDRDAEIVYQAKFAVSVDAKDGQGMNLCKGDAFITVYTDMSARPTGKLACIAEMNKDLSQMFDGEAEKEPILPGVYAESGIIQRSANPKAGTEGSHFDPPMPFILGPIVQNPDLLKNYRHSEASTLRVISPSGYSMDTTGSFTIDVVNHSETVTADLTGEVYDNVIHWRNTSSGFQNVIKADHKIFDQWDWWWRPRPISIVKMEMRTTLGELVDPQEAGSMGSLLGIGDAMFGTIIISWKLKEEIRNE